MKVVCGIFLVGVFLLAGLVVFIIQSSNVILKNKRIFHKRRIIKVTHESGEIVNVFYVSCLVRS